MSIHRVLRSFFALLGCILLGSPILALGQSDDAVSLDESLRLVLISDAVEQAAAVARTAEKGVTALIYDHRQTDTAKLV
ncbi:MAG: hypothetical protein L0Y56_10005, partial [Nitrospira sp.]|nr:hypothetical protein [Nitrospira sp.]